MQNIPGRVQMLRRGLQHTRPAPQVVVPQRTPVGSQRTPAASATQVVPDAQRTAAQRVMQRGPVSPSTHISPAGHSVGVLAQVLGTQRAPRASATQTLPAEQRTVAQAVMQRAPSSPSTQMVPGAQVVLAQVGRGGWPQR
jgi:hypothetical protein